MIPPGLPGGLFAHYESTGVSIIYQSRGKVTCYEQRESIYIASYNI